MDLTIDIKEEFTDSSLSQISSLFELSAKDTHLVFDIYLPGLLGSIAIKGSNRKGARKILNLIKSIGFGQDNKPDYEEILYHNDKFIYHMETGADILSIILGNNKPELLDLLATNSNLKKSKGAKILNFLSPIVLNKIAVIIKDNNYDAESISNLCSSQSSDLAAMMPGLKKIFEKPKTEPKIHSIEGFNNKITKPKKKWWKWGIFLFYSFHHIC